MMLLPGVIQFLGIISFLGTALLVPCVGVPCLNEENSQIMAEDLTIIHTFSTDEYSVFRPGWGLLIGTGTNEDFHDLSRAFWIHLNGTHNREETSNTSAFRPQEYMIGMTRYMDKGHFPRSPDFANLYRCVLLS